MAALFGLARLGRDAEVRFTQGGEPVASLSLAFNYGKKGADGKRPTQWVDGALWGKRAEALAPYLLKGTLLAVTVEDIHIEVYKTQQGEGHKLAGNVTQVELAGGGQAAAPVAAPAPRPAPRAPQSGGFPADDDIPFAPYMSRKEWSA
jgi:single-strand DNA-binding protein